MFHDQEGKEKLKKKKWCLGVSVFSVFSMFRCFAVSLFRCFAVSLFRCFAVSLFRCFNVSFWCFGVSFRRFVA